MNTDNHLFSIQVAIPALHISLGCYLKFFNMLEFESHLLDVKIAGELGLRNKTLNQKEYNDFIRSQKQIRELELRAQDIHETIELMTTAVHSYVLKDPENEANILKIFAPRFEHFNEKLLEKVYFERIAKRLSM